MTRQRVSLSLIYSLVAIILVRDLIVTKVAVPVDQVIVGLCLLWSLAISPTLCRGRTGNKFFVIYYIYILLLVILWPLLSVAGPWLSAIIGFAALAGLIPLFLDAAKSKGTNFFLKLLLFYSIVNAVGVLIQFWISIDLFGLISHPTYTNEATVSKPNVTRRAVSFVSSPQSLTIILAAGFCVSCVMLSNYRRSWMWFFFSSLFMISGVLTFSKAFYLFIAAFFVIYSKTFFLIVTCLCSITVLTSEFWSETIPGLHRIIMIPKLILNPSQYSAFDTWLDGVSFSTNSVQVVLGNGLGFASRSGQAMGGYSVLDGSTESFLIQLYLEAGIVGLVFFSLYNGWLILKYQGNKTFRCLLFATLVVALVTPALYGLPVTLLYCIFIGGITGRPTLTGQRVYKPDTGLVTCYSG